MAKVEITINGVAYPCRQTMGAMLRFKEETGKEVTEIDPGSFTDVCTYLWCCIKSASKADGLNFDLSLMDFADGVMPEDAKAWAEANKEQSGDGTTENGDAPEEKNLGINDYLGFAMGCLRLSFDDFCRCTPKEFESICKAYHDQR